VLLQQQNAAHNPAKTGNPFWPATAQPTRFFTIPPANKDEQDAKRLFLASEGLVGDALMTKT
jgi:hypothetical protein